MAPAFMPGIAPAFMPGPASKLSTEVIVPTRVERGRLYFQTVEDLATRFTVAAVRPALIAKDGAR